MKKTVVPATDENLLANLTLYDFPASILAEFTEKTVKPYYNGNLNATIQNLIQKAIACSFPYKAYSYSMEA